ncbi:cupin [Erwinia mallotivora]|uniref:cupin n=1 Tax=Erwinia mallotivora TaxID=69222 RepID=UPI0021C0F598|nr:cupin [Erwinia mallotivora]
MTESEFRAILKQQGYSEPVLVERAANSCLDWHSHPFEAMALILDGDITITNSAEKVTYSAGQTFHLLTDEQHEEYFGSKGVKYLSGRKS